MTYHQISGDQHPDFSGPKVSHHGIALHLRPIGVNDIHVDAVVHQFAVQGLGSFNRLDKHDDRRFQSLLPGEGRIDHSVVQEQKQKGQDFNQRYLQWKPKVLKKVPNVHKTYTI